MGGYDKHPDYGGPPGSRLGGAMIIGAMLLVAVVVAWISFG